MGNKAVYKITAEGRQIAWSNSQKLKNSSPSLSSSSTADLLARPPGLEDHPTRSMQSLFGSEPMQATDAACDCLHDLLHDADLRDLFRAFSNGKLFDDYLSFILEYDELKFPIPAALGSSLAGLPLTDTRVRRVSDSIAALYDNHVRRWDLSQLRLDDDLRRGLCATDRGPAKATHSTQLEATLRRYEGVRGAVVKLICEDVIPQVCFQ